MLDRDKLKEYIEYLKEGFKEMATIPDMQDPKKGVQPYRSCRDCELIAAGFSLTLCGYFYYLTRMSRIHPPAGGLLCLGSAMCAATALLNQRPYKKVRDISISDIFVKNQTHSTDSVERDDKN